LLVQACLEFLALGCRQLVGIVHAPAGAQPRHTRLAVLGCPLAHTSLSAPHDRANYRLGLSAAVQAHRLETTALPDIPALPLRVRKRGEFIVGEVELSFCYTLNSTRSGTLYFGYL
jgi:hypothetical protein